ncbi:hypothetical protein BDR04DRAFT_1103717 [Suillus decipiens]|nr:hypothetical protein BDR04DRAFT_1103717 [Suillus decipiens]
MGDDQSLAGTWARLSEVAIKGAQYNSRERQPHPKCLQGTRVDLLKYIYGFLDNTENNQLIWLHGTAGIGKSAVAFTVAENMKGQKVTEETDVEMRLAGTFFFSRKHTERCTAGYFFATLVYQLGINFPSIQKDLSRAIEKKIHRRILLTPCGLPLTQFNDIPELIGVFRDLVVAHKAMVGRRVLHGDLSPNNIIIYEGKGYFIDFDHAKFLDADGQADESPCGTGTVPYISFRVLRLMGDGHSVRHTPCDDLESLFYILLEFTIIYLGPKGALAPRSDEENLQRDPVRRWGIAYESLTRDGLATSSMWKREFIHGLTDPPLVTSYFTPCRVLLDEWRQAISFASTQSTAISHDDICDILTRESCVCWI